MTPEEFKKEFLDTLNRLIFFNGCSSFLDPKDPMNYICLTDKMEVMTLHPRAEIELPKYLIDRAQDQLGVAGEHQAKMGFIYYTPEDFD